MTTPTSDVDFAQAAAMLTGHLANHAVPEPVVLSVTTSYGDSTLTAQLNTTTLPGLAGDLLAWANTLDVAGVEAWRPPERDRVHLSLHATLTGSAGAVGLKVFGAVDYDPHWFANLQPHPCQGISLRLDSCAAGRRTPPPRRTLRSSRHPGALDDPRSHPPAGHGAGDRDSGRTDGL